MNHKILLALISVLFFSAIAANAQRGYTEFETEDNMKTMYRWQRASFFKKDSDAVLNLRITNENETAVNLSFIVGFYDEGLLVYQSEENQLCFKPGQSRRGGLAGLRFTLEDFKTEDLENEGFAWDFVMFDVEEVESCNP